MMRWAPHTIPIYGFAAVEVWWYIPLLLGYNTLVWSFTKQSTLLVCGHKKRCQDGERTRRGNKTRKLSPLLLYLYIREETNNNTHNIYIGDLSCRNRKLFVCNYRTLEYEKNGAQKRLNTWSYSSPRMRGHLANSTVSTPLFYKDGLLLIVNAHLMCRQLLAKEYTCCEISENFFCGSRLAHDVMDYWLSYFLLVHATLTTTSTISSYTKSFTMFAFGPNVSEIIFGRTVEYSSC